MKRQTLWGIFQLMTEKNPRTRERWFSYRHMHARRLEYHINDKEHEKYEVLSYAWRPLAAVINYKLRKRFYSVFIQMDVIDMEKWQVREFFTQYDGEMKVKELMTQGWKGKIYDELIPKMEQEGFGRYVGHFRIWDYSINNYNWKNDWVHPTKKGFNVMHVWQETDGTYLLKWKNLYKKSKSWYAKYWDKQCRKDIAKLLKDGIPVREFEKIKKKYEGKKDKMVKDDWEGHWINMFDSTISKEDEQGIIRHLMFVGDGEDE